MPGAVTFFTAVPHKGSCPTDENNLQAAAGHPGVSVLLSVAAARQSPDATAAQEASVGAGAARPAQESQRQAAQPGAVIPAAPLSDVFLSTDGHLPHLHEDIQTQRNEQGFHRDPRKDPQHPRECQQTQDPSVCQQIRNDHAQDSRQKQDPRTHTQVLHLFKHFRTGLCSRQASIQVKKLGRPASQQDSHARGQPGRQERGLERFSVVTLSVSQMLFFSFLYPCKSKGVDPCCNQFTPETAGGAPA